MKCPNTGNGTLAGNETHPHAPRSTPRVSTLDSSRNQAAHVTARDAIITGAAVTVSCDPLHTDETSRLAEHLSESILTHKLNAKDVKTKLVQDTEIMQLLRKDGSNCKNLERSPSTPVKQHDNKSMSFLYADSITNGRYHQGYG